jgi:hypothetical protein
MVISFLRVRATEVAQFDCNTVGLPFSFRKSGFPEFFQVYRQISWRSISCKSIEWRGPGAFFVGRGPADAPTREEERRAADFFSGPKAAGAFFGKKFPKPKKYPLDNPPNPIY